MPLLEHETYDYAIDEADLIVSVNDAWIDFARQNGATEITRDAVIGRSLWDFVAGSSTQSFYRAVFHRVRSENIEVAIAFRCDSPDLLRHMELHVRPRPEGSLELRGRLLRQERRTFVPLIDRLLSSSAQSFVVCSLCKRVLAFGEWLQPEEAVQRFHVFETVHEPSVEHGVCDRCEALSKYAG